MKLSDEKISQAIKEGKKIKRLSWGHGESVKMINGAHYPDRQPMNDTNEPNDWVIVEK